MYVAPPFEPYSQPAKLMQPTQRAFNNPSMYSQATAMCGTPLCQHRTDVEPSQLLAKGPRVVCPVSVELTWTPSRPASLASHWGYRLHQGKRLSDVVRIGSSQRSGQRNPLSVGNHVVLASCLGSIGRVGAREVPPKTALTDALSTTARLQSIRSALCNCSKRRSCSLSHTPACCQSRSLRQHVIPLPQPISWGRSSQGMPVLRTNSTPVNACRSGIRGRPPFGFGGSGGNRGLICSHNSSVTNIFAMASLLYLRLTFSSVTIKRLLGFC